MLDPTGAVGTQAVPAPVDSSEVFFMNPPYKLITKRLRASTAAALLVATVLSTGMSRAQSAQMVDPNRVVLVINGEEVKGAEYYRRMEYLSGIGTRSGNNFVEMPPGFITIQHLIDERMTFALAKDKGVYPTDAEVDAEINLRQQDNPKMLETYIAAGGNIEELKYQIRVQLAEFKIATFGITKTDAEVELFYKDHPDLYKTPKMLKLRLIAVGTSDDTKVVDQELAAGKPFATVAKEKSVDVTKAIGGEYGTIPEYKLATVAKDALTGVKIGQSTVWLSTAQDGGQGTYLKFLLEDVIPEAKQPLDARLKRIVRRQLMLDAGRVKNGSATKELDLLRAKAKIDIKQPEFAEAYKKFLEAYLKQKGITQ